MRLSKLQSRRCFLNTTALGTAAAWLAARTNWAGASEKPSLLVTDPIDGAVMHNRLGRKVDGGLEIDVRGSAPAGATVLVDGRPAEREGETFLGKALLTDSENEVVVVAQADGEQQESRIRLPWVKNSEKRYRVVIDDNSFFLRDITQKGYDSLFDCFYLKMLKDLHDKYGATFTLNIYYTTGDDWNLSQFPDRYRDEWRANASWLRLAFHAHANDPPRPYQDAPVEKLLADLEQVNEQILRFAGPEAFSDAAVIHFAMTRPEAWKPLYDKGSRVLGGYFVFWNRWDINYNMDDFRSEWLSRNDLLKDYPSGIVFSKVDMVINNTPLDQIVPKIDAAMADPRQGEVIDFLTHEQYFWPFYHNYLPDHPQRMDRAIEYVTRHGYKPVFLQDEFDERKRR
ncbi:MAG: hypothetical protein U1E05_25805 [Patescibacteria group bacterium]|nr:hypothetical protein [Patescibacteria group bacterium]